MTDLSKIDFTRILLPCWNEQCVTCKRGPLGLELKRFHHRFAHRSLDACGVWQYCGPSRWNDLEVAKTYTDRVDAFIAEESARLVREATPESRQCTRDFALRHPNESEWRVQQHDGHRLSWSTWQPMSRVPLFQASVDDYEFRTTARERNKPDIQWFHDARQYT